MGLRSVRPAFFVFAAAGALACAACSSAAVDESDDETAADEGALTSSELGARGEKQIHFAVDGRSDELCILSKKSAGGLYSTMDRTLEASLCALTFRGAASSAVCPTIAGSLEPAIELRAGDCTSGDRRATFKQSVTCSYTGSILGYYHLSRFLGGAGAVPPAVIRTMDLDAHAALVPRAIAATSKVDQGGFDLHDAWVQYQTMDASPHAFGRFAQVYTADAQQLYGALISEVALTTTHPFMRTAHGDAGIEQFVQGTAFGVVTDPRPLPEIFPTTFDKTSVQGVVLAKDASDMVLMDELMSQADRYGNVQSLAFEVFEDAGQLAKVALTRDPDTGAPIERPDARGVVVEELVLRDNECGVTKENRNAKLGLVAKLTHLSAATYRHYQWFARELANQSSTVAGFMREEALLTPMDLEFLSTRATALATTLRQRCDSGALMLDADLGPHLRGETKSPNPSACAAAEPPRASSASTGLIDSHGIALIATGPAR